MLDLFPPLLSKTVAQLLQQGRDAIFPFTEAPAVTRDEESKSPDDTSAMSATNLFSMFTADIIKEQVVFTR
ncbi:MAG: hypothetical protein JWQ27_6 [Ferruginibacter sp.]|nr:hypothetical protein [Ferruginibacter sp.]